MSSPREPLPSRYIDERFDPVIISQMPARFVDLELDAFFARHEWLLDRQIRYATITDLSGLVGIPDADTRRRIAEWNTRIEPKARRFTIATAVVAPNAMLRGALTAVHWLSPPPYPQAVVGDAPAAVEALEKLYREAREPVPPELARYRDTLHRRPSARP